MTSDLFTLKTASAPKPEVEIKSLIATSNDSIISLLPQQDGKSSGSLLVVPESTSFKFRFTINKNFSNVSSVEAFLRLKNVLGLSFPVQALADTQISNLVELAPGIWEGSISTSEKPGDYLLYARIKDTKGNITEQKITDIKVINKFRVLSPKNRSAVEGARVLFYVFSPTNKKYVRIPSSEISGGNPQFTDRDGKLSLVLPQGKYKADISQVGFKDKTVYFSISPASGFPVIELERSAVTPLSVLNFYARTVNDIFLYNTQLYASILTGSVRFFDLVAAFILASFVLLTLFAFLRRHRIPLSSVASYFYYLLDHNGNKNNYIEGVIFDEDDKPIPGANVYLNDGKSEEIVARTKTNKRGEFFFRRKAGSEDKYMLLVMAKSYKSSSLIPYEPKSHVHLKITLEKEHEGLNIFENALNVISGSLGMSFEGLLVLTIFFEILFLEDFGVLKTLPFLAVSIFNLIIWTMHTHHHRFISQ
jgi:hypothetical protein